MGFTLYKRDGSSPARAVLMTIEALGITDVEFVDVDLFVGEQLKPEYLEMNPQHTIPTLKEADGFVLWDSHAIVTYLVNKYAANDELYPTDIKKRALVDQRLHFDNGILFRVLRETVLPMIFNGETSIKPENVAKIISGYEFTEKFLTSPWLAGNDVTLADICCVASISSLNTMVPIDENKFPKVTAWLKRCGEKDFYKKKNLPGLADYQQMMDGLVA